MCSLIIEAPLGCLHKGGQGTFGRYSHVLQISCPPSGPPCAHILVLSYNVISSKLWPWTAGASRASGAWALRKCSRSGSSHFRLKNLRSRSCFDSEHEPSLEVWPVNCAYARVSATFAGRWPRDLPEFRGLRACGGF